ncbi:arsenate reductase ArsC [Methanolobus sp. WCC5]|jgi:arsenate reductase|uniref:arsenate reductase ArsC n=1 Tax=Methanolobus sp. WCC5 TaxID=3125785 RepID=UPI003252252F
MASVDDRTKVLFICVHNSGRSQIAEEYLKRIGGDRFEVESAGFKPTGLDPLIKQVMEEDGFDLRDKKTQAVWDLFREGRLFKYVITVCDRANEEECPIFPRPFVQLNWPFPDPAAFTGTEDEKLEQARTLRDSIRKRIQQFVEETKEPSKS